ncbi:hypothetical protein ABII15_02185 [Streptomyces sp. HUAS MG91]|uniref:Uncharacterized protein n=1 Tax=Streptomyces tabacisoli TaxID=3156398 RepID=A0AAU8IL65_9ACTN
MTVTAPSPHPAETKREVKGRIRTCRPARRGTGEPAGPDHEPDGEWNLVRGED